MNVLSWTPEGPTYRCPICGRIERIDPSQPPGDAICPFCGALLWPADQLSGEVDPSTVAETRRSIRACVHKIGELAESEMAWEVFCRDFLPLVVRCLAARGGAVWTFSAAGLRLTEHVGMAESGASSRAPPMAVVYAARHKRAVALAPYARMIEGPDVCNDTACTLLLQPIVGDGRRTAVLEILQRPGAGNNVIRGYQRFLQQMADIARPVLR